MFATAANFTKHVFNFKQLWVDLNGTRLIAQLQTNLPAHPAAKYKWGVVTINTLSWFPPRASFSVRKIGNTFTFDNKSFDYIKDGEKSIELKKSGKRIDTNVRSPIRTVKQRFKGSLSPCRADNSGKCISSEKLFLLVFQGKAGRKRRFIVVERKSQVKAENQ